MLLVGEANPRSADPLHALWPTPNSAGGRLCKMLGMTRWGYLHKPLRQAAPQVEQGPGKRRRQ